METKKFIHGDLNKKNIIYTNNGFKIIDFEPSLHQIKNGMKQLMITMPYIIKSDLDNQKLTILTDKISFIYFLLRITRKMKSMDVVKLSKSLNHERFLNIKFNEIKKMTYNQLLDIFL